MAVPRLLLASTFEVFGDRLDGIPGLSWGESDVVCIPTGAYAESEHGWVDAEIAPVRARAGSFTEFDIAGKSPSQVREALSAADVIYVTGGNTYVLLEKMKDCRFGEIVRERLACGAVYSGCSAGSVVACPRIDFIGEMDDRSRASLPDFEGLSLVDFLVMPHTDHPFYGDLARRVMDEYSRGAERILGLKDCQALWVDGAAMAVIG